VTKAALAPELQELRNAYASGASAKVLLDDFANRTNNQRMTTVDQLLNRLRGANVQRWEVIALFRKLEQLKHGTFIEGRKGHQSRFVWSSSPIDVGKAAQGEEAPIAPVPMDVPADDSSAELRKYVFPLRTSADVSFELPTDLSQKEADRLAAFLRSLALPE
jgi:hypothetical protein